MKSRLQALTLMMLVSAWAATPAHAIRHYRILSSGYYDGPSVAGTAGWDQVFSNFPVGLEADLGYSWSDLGDATLACQVFINQNQNNNPSKSSGGTLHLALNMTYPLPMKLGPAQLFVIGGPRWARWAARHQYLNNNEDFDVVGKVWGLGGGVRGNVKLSEKFTAVMQLTMDYYPRASIYGHDATYYPDNNNVNERNNGAGYTYTYEDAVRATRVPHIRPRVLVGVMF
jgi:hypothetical protein